MKPLTFEQWFKKRYKREPDVKGVWYDAHQKEAWDAAARETRAAAVPYMHSDGPSTYVRVELPKTTPAPNRPSVGAFCKACGHFQSDHGGCAAGPYCNVEGCTCVDGSLNPDMSPLYLTENNTLTPEPPL